MITELTYQPLPAHWADLARDAYWSNPTKAQALALFLFTVAVGSIAVMLA